MPLNTDPNALSDAEYWARYDRVVAIQQELGSPACGNAPPEAVIVRVEAELDEDGESG